MPSLNNPRKSRIIVKSMVLGFFMLIDTCLIPFESKKHCFKTLNNNFQNCLYFHFRKFFQEFLVISSDSSQIVVEDKGNYFLGGDRMNTTNTFITVPEIQEVLWYPSQRHTGLSEN